MRVRNYQPVPRTNAVQRAPSPALLGRGETCLLVAAIAIRRFGGLAAAAEGSLGRAINFFARRILNNHGAGSADRTIGLGVQIDGASHARDIAAFALDRRAGQGNASRLVAAIAPGAVLGRAAAAKPGLAAYNGFALQGDLALQMQRAAVARQYEQAAKQEPSINAWGAILGAEFPRFG